MQSKIRKEWCNNLSTEERLIINTKISKSSTGKVGYWLGKTNKKHSQWMKENNPMKGKTHSNEVKQIISEFNSKPKSDLHKKNISKYSPNNKQCIIEGNTYRSVAEAGRQLDIPENTVRGRVKNKKFKNWYYG